MTPIPPEVAHQAVQWFLALQAAEVTADTRHDWQRWRAADPLHERAWQRIEAVSSRLRSSGSPLVSAVAQARLRADATRGGRRRTIRTLASMLLAGSSTWLVYEHTPWRPLLARHRTGIGEQRMLVLADGTEVMLNTATALSTHFDASERRLALIEGEILVTSAPDTASPPRPLRVETAHGMVRAIGTRFSVRLLEGASRVAVFDGEVEVSVEGRSSQPAVAPQHVPAGRQVRWDRNEFAASKPVDQADEAWTRGTILALSMRLDDFLAELERYSDTPLSCLPAVAGMRLSGSYPTNDIAAVLGTIASVLGLQLQAEPGFWGRRPRRFVLMPRHGAG